MTSNRIHRWFCLLSLCASVSLCSGTAHCIAAKQIRIVHEHGRDTANVQCVVRGGVIFVSLDELGRAMQAVTARKSGMAVLTFDGIMIECRDGNRFVKTIGPDRHSHVYQLNAEPFLQSNQMYIPARTFVDVLILSAPFPIEFDRDHLIVSLSRNSQKSSLQATKPSPEKRSGRVGIIPTGISSIVIEEKTNGYTIALHFGKKVQKHISVILADSQHLHIRCGVIAFDSANLKYNPPDIREMVSLHSISSDDLMFSFVQTVGAVSGIASKNVYTVLVRTSRRTARSAIREKWKMNTIVLDAGHGGKDPGAQGVSGTNEKDVTLGVVLKLGTLLQEAGFHVVYTRKTDTFVELYRRGEIANEAGGKLFVSIHCNSMPVKPNPSHGIETYILRPGKTEEAARVAARENNSVRLESDRARYANLTDENYIVASMAQSAFVRWSEKFAELVQRDVPDDAPSLKSNGVSQAGFLVLIGASMPSVLIETGYISNPQEERFLSGSRGQWEIARGICAAVKQYRVEYEKTVLQ